MVQCLELCAAYQVRKILVCVLRNVELVISYTITVDLDKASDLIQQSEDALKQINEALLTRRWDDEGEWKTHGRIALYYKQLWRIWKCVKRRTCTARRLVCHRRNAKCARHAETFLLYPLSDRRTASQCSRVPVFGQKLLPVFLPPKHSFLKERGRCRVPKLSIPYRIFIKSASHLSTPPPHVPNFSRVPVNRSRRLVENANNCQNLLSAVVTEENPLSDQLPLSENDDERKEAAEQNEEGRNRTSIVTYKKPCCSMASMEACGSPMRSLVGQSETYKLRASLSMSSLRGGSPLGRSCREREVKSEERCLPRSFSSAAGPASPVVDSQMDSPRIGWRTHSSKDDFWEALRSHYNYLMDDELIATCREATGELLWDEEGMSPTYCWSFTEFIQQFNQLHDWLHMLQTAVSEQSERDRDAISSNVMDELERKGFRCKIFNEQAQRLGKRYPNMKDEINRRVNLLNNKLAALETAVNPHKPAQSEDGVFQEIAQEMRCLRKWLRELEDRLQPLMICPTWTLQDLEDKYKEQQALQKQIESRGKYVSSLLKLCDRLGSEGEDDEGNRGEAGVKAFPCDAERVRRVAANLERRWHAIWLRSLEWQCLIEELIRKNKLGFLPGDPNLELSFSEEPLCKYPRLGNEGDDNWALHRGAPDNEVMETEQWQQGDAGGTNGDMLEAELMIEDSGRREVGIICGYPGESPHTNDKCIMVGKTSIAELKAECGTNGRFEIIQDVGYSSESSAHLSNDERTESIRVFCYSPAHKRPTLISEYTIGETGKIGQEYHHNLSDSMPANGNVELPNSPKWSDEEAQAVLMNTSSNSGYYVYKYAGTEYSSESSDPGSNDKEGHLRNACESPPVKYLSPSRSRHGHSLRSFLEGGSSDPDTSFLLGSSTLTGGLTDIDTFGASDIEFSALSSNKTVQNGGGSCNREEIHELVAKAETLVHEDKLVHERGSGSLRRRIKPLKFGEKSGKASRVQEWLQTCQGNPKPEKEGSELESAAQVADSSCDASGEYTTNESESDDSSVGEMNNSIAMSKSGTGSVETVVPAVDDESGKRAGSAEPPPRVVLRNKKRRGRDRPWSVVELYQLSNRLDLSPFSTSEGALNVLLTPTTPTKDKPPKFHGSSTSIGMQKDLPSPLHDQTPTSTHLQSGRKLRCYRSRSSLNSCRNRSDSGSDGLSHNSRHSQRRASFCNSGGSDSTTHSSPSRRPRSRSCLNHSSASEGTSHANTASPARHRVSNPRSCRSSLSGSMKTLLNLFVGEEAQPTPQSEESEQSDSKEVPVPCPSPPTTVEESGPPSSVQQEDQSSVYDQAWDGYQDPPYLSEPYSENTVDEDIVRKLIEFGDDYRAFIGSQSDASSVSGPREMRRTPPKSRASSVSSWAPSNSATQNTEVLDCDTDSDVEELQHILSESIRAYKFAEETLRVLLNQSGSPQASADYAELLATCQTNLKCLQVIGEHLDSGHSLSTLTDDDVKELRGLISQWEMLQAETLERHRENTDLQQDIEKLRAKMTELAQLATPQTRPFQNIEELEKRIKDLQASLSALQEIKDKSLLPVNIQVHNLMSKAGLTSSPLKNDVVKLYHQWDEVYEMNGTHLTELETQLSQWQQNGEAEVAPETKEKNGRFEHANGHVCEGGRRSERDSGFDETPSRSESWKDLTSCLQEVDSRVNELRRRHPSLRAVADAIAVIASEDAGPAVPSSSAAPASGVSEESSVSRQDKGEDHHRSRFWRVVRAALPIQLALVLLYCLACLLEPNCCDFLNNFNFSFSPQLRYVRGPPPV